ncbi:putative cyclic di-GMP phosphodiesterase [biofilm metagenome]
MNQNGGINMQTNEIDQMNSLNVFIRAMAYLAESRESGNGNRINRTEHYVKALAKELIHNPRFENTLKDESAIETLSKVAPLQDIGNVGIPDRILLKPGRLTPDEYDVIKTHTALGHDIIEQAERDLGIEVGLPSFVKEVVYSHHERWDGSGYPEGLFGDDIPGSARIIMVADVYDALVSRRVYKPAISHNEAIKVIRENKGTHFDPDVVEAFEDCHDEFHRIAYMHADSEKDFKRQIDYLEKAIAIEP